MKRLLDGFERLLTRLLFLRALLLIDQPFHVRFERHQGFNQGRIPLILNDATARTGREIEERHVNEPLDVARHPRRMVQTRQRRQILDYPGSHASQCHSRSFIGLREIQFRIGVPENGPNRRQLMQQSALKLSRLHFILLARQLIDHRDPRLRVADPVPQLGGQVPLDLLPAQGPDALEQGADLQLRAFLRK